MENISTENQQMNDAPKRPQFLTVLCILTFIGSALAIISAIMGYFSAQASAAMISNMDSMGNDPTGMMSEMQGMAQKAVDNAVPNLVIAIVCALLCLFGALQMWKLKKTGFYIYTVGEIVPPISVFILMGGGLFGGITSVLTLLVAIVFVVLYALNLKHMK